VYRTTAFSELGTFARNAEVAFEVDEIDPQRRTGRSVVVLWNRQTCWSEKKCASFRCTVCLTRGSTVGRETYFRIKTREVTGRRIDGETGVGTSRATSAEFLERAVDG